MAKKKDEKDVLIVRDEKTGEISVVAGLNADGTPKRTPAKAENAQSFLQFDRHGDVLDNFFRNFFRQCKEPSRFGFYRVAAEQADNLLEVMKELLKNPEAYSELLAPHKVDTSGYEQEVQKVQEEQQQQREEEQQPDQENKENQEEPKNQEEMEQKQEQNQEAPQQTQGRQGYQPIDENRINWQEVEEEVIAAAKAAHADHFIRTLPGGYQMELNEDASNVSQGQKQLLTIARAILADNKILILDEATSSVDTRTEVAIQKAMDHLMKGRTSFVIAHRLSTIRDADMILVMKDGDIVEQGRHEELLKKQGFYANLYNSQFEETVA